MNNCAQGERVYVDAGVDGRYLLGQYAYDSLFDKRTWEVPAISPLNAPLPAPDCAAQNAREYVSGGVRVRVLESAACGARAYSAELVNEGEHTRRVNGLAFTVLLDARADIDFPLNTPHGVIRGEALKPMEVAQAGLVSPAIHARTPEGDENILFMDVSEKWSLGVYRASEGLRAVFIAALECDLAAGERVECGTLYIQSPQGDPYIAIRDFFESMGYSPARGGLNTGVMYSCHPNGTMDGCMDSNERGQSLYKFAEHLPALKNMGVDHVWLLPIFEHEGRGVYHTSDQSVIDKRYGGDDAVRYYVNKAHALNMTVLFDYVPHGPAPADPLALEHPEWRSLRADGTPQEEWECVSFDMTLPEYRKYTTDLVKDHVRRFDIDGARIDCAMGGLSNWASARPSASNLAGGVHITRAIYEGFRAFPKRTLVLPENFNPVPAYYPVTDVFYGMNFYRLLVELDQQYRNEPEKYVHELTRWLEIEHKTLPEALGRLRFLGNHDTVSWVWQASRAVDFYGLERARALFALVFLIDGMPMLYMGDEDPALAGKQGAVLIDFFRELIALRKSTVGDGEVIKYIYTNSSVFAMTRRNDARAYIVAINLGGARASIAHNGVEIWLNAYEWKVVRL